jgi:hypothetical protein
MVRIPPKLDCTSTPTVYPPTRATYDEVSDVRKRETLLIRRAEAKNMRTPRYFDHVGRLNLFWSRV